MEQMFYICYLPLLLTNGFVLQATYIILVIY